jgi:GAF domain-containing protein
MTDGRPAPDDAAVVALRAVAHRLALVEQLEPTPTDAWLTSVVETAALTLDAQAASVAIHDPATDRLVFVAAAGPSAGEVVGLSIDAAAGIAGFAFTTGQPIAIADVAADPRFDRTVADATGYIPGTLMAVPLADERGIVGVLEALDRRGGSFTLRDLDVGAAFARQATLAVRAGRSGRDAAAILRATLRALDREASAADGPDAPALDDEAIDALVAAALPAGDADDAGGPDAWALADRLARLRVVDPDLVELAGEWLDALLRRRGGTGRRGSTTR